MREREKQEGLLVFAHTKKISTKNGIFSFISCFDFSIIWVRIFKEKIKGREIKAQVTPAY
jgi:hypothetical protein